MTSPHSFVVVLPDSPGLEHVVRRLVKSTDVRADHPSGRPWLLGRTGRNVPLRVIERTVGVAVVGPTSIDGPELERFAASPRTAQEFSRLQAGHAGSFCVLGAFEGAVYASAPATQTRRIFRADIAGVTLFADRADVLAELGKFSLDLTAVASRLARGLPHPADDLPTWQGVSGVTGGDFVVARPRGITESHTWWCRPEPELTRAEGAVLFRDAIAEAVAVRGNDRGALACDLSGGLDSTPLCYFASQQESGLLARTFFTADPGGREDLEWARRALPAMANVREHLVFSADGLPAFYEDLLNLGVRLDEPTQAGASIPRIRHMLRDDIERGVDVHLNGLGGDHLLRGVRAWNHTLARTRPLLAWSRARAEDIPSGVSSVETMKQLVDKRSYRRWILDTGRAAAAGIAPPELPRSNDWSVPLSLPAWLSHEGRDAVLSRLRAVTEVSEPLAASLAGHFDLFTVRQAGRLARSMGLIGDAFGVAYESPLLDDRVVDAVFSVRYEERDSPVEWKPLMKTAMAGLLPDDYLRRTTKIGGAPQAVRGYAAHYSRLRELWERSGLWDSGLIDIAALDRLGRPSATSPPSTHVHALTDAAIFLESQQDSAALAYSHSEEH